MKRNYIETLEDTYVASFGPAVPVEAATSLKKQFDTYLNRIFKIDSGYIGDYTQQTWDKLKDEWDSGKNPYIAVEKIIVDSSTLDEETRGYLVKKVDEYVKAMVTMDVKFHGVDHNTSNRISGNNVGLLADSKWVRENWKPLVRQYVELPARDYQPSNQHIVVDPPDDSNAWSDFVDGFKKGFTGAAGYSSGLVNDTYNNISHGDKGNNGLQDLMDGVFSDLLGVDSKVVIWVILGLVGLYVAVEVKEIIK